MRALLVRKTTAGDAGPNTTLQRLRARKAREIRSFTI